MTRLRVSASIVAAALLLGTSSGIARQTPAPYTDFHFYSEALGRDMPYRVLAPARNRGADGGADTARLPVLYLLHGLGGTFSDWSTRTRLAEHAAESGVLIVMPEGANSWYVNWHEGDRERWEDYIVRDLVAEVDARFPTDTRREARFIAGLSMGGYGALRMALAHPETYALAASLSGAFDVARRETYGWDDDMRAAFLRTFGPGGSEVRRTTDLLTLAERVAPNGLPFLYIDCGADDPFLPVNRQFVETLQRRGIPYEYRETPGRHDWRYWDRQVVQVLRVLEATAFVSPADR